jgi:large subunit ribosomal protein L9
MKVILLQDIAKIGRKFEIKEVANGFAMNFLIPHGKAQFADNVTVQRIESQRKRELEKKKGKDEELSTALKEQKELVIKAKANEEGHLFAKIDGGKVADFLTSSVGYKVEDTQINLETPIKEAGEHTIGVLVGEKTVDVTIKVVAE